MAILFLFSRTPVTLFIRRRPFFCSFFLFVLQLPVFPSDEIRDHLLSSMVYRSTNPEGALIVKWTL